MPTYRLRKLDEESGEVTPQFGFWSSRNKVQIFGGAFANGKTTALVLKALKLATDYPGSNGLLARETFPKLNDTLRKVFFEWCPVDFIRRRPTADDNTCYFKNGSVINFRYVAQRGKSREDGSTTSNLLSATYDWIGVDQVEDPGIMYKDFLDLLGRLRGATTYRPMDEDDATMPANGPRWLMLTSNPSQNWFYKEVVQPYIIWRDRGIRTEKLLVDESSTPIVDLFEGSTYSNQENLATDYIKSLEATYRGQMRERFLLGKWAAFEGLVHPEFSTTRNVLTRAEAMTHLADCLGRHVKVQVLEGYDFGLAAPSCYMLAFIDDLGRVVVVDGFYRSEFNYLLQPEEVFTIRAKYRGMLEATKPVQADPAIFRRQVVAGSKNTGDTLASLFKNLELNIRQASNEILAGIAKVNSYIAGHDRIPHIVTGDKPGPLLYVVEDLEWFMDEIFSYYWKRNPQGQHIDQPIDNNDHAMNTIKYMLAHLPEPSKLAIPESTLPPQWLYWHELEDAQA